MLLIIAILGFIGSYVQYEHEQPEPVVDYKDKSKIIIAPNTIYADVDFFIAKLLTEKFREKGIDVKTHFFQIIRRMQMIYSWHNIKVLPYNVEFWEHGDKMNILMYAFQDNWNNLIKYHKTLSDKGDMAILFVEIPRSNYRHEGGMTGYATLGWACNAGVGVVQGGSEVNFDEKFTANLASHELGHTFGMNHVPQRNNECECAANQECIMHNYIYDWDWVVPPLFHTCSIKEAIEEYNTRICLQTPNKKHFDMGSSCGNGIVEEGEECDCGTKEVCEFLERNCCTPQCKFAKPEYNCDGGSCCENCQSKKVQICRDAENECDIAEFCDGISGHCPEDRKKINGEVCNDQFYCGNGKCIVPDDVCRISFPEEPNTFYSHECDQHLLSEQSKNCPNIRSNADAYHIICANYITRDICGFISCSGDLEKQQRAIKFDFPQQNGRYQSCNIPHYNIFSSNSTKPDGFKCGDNKICQNSLCESISNLKKCQDCPLYTTCSDKLTCLPYSLDYFNKNYLHTTTPPITNTFTTKSTTNTGCDDSEEVTTTKHCFQVSTKMGKKTMCVEITF